MRRQWLLALTVIVAFVCSSGATSDAQVILMQPVDLSIWGQYQRLRVVIQEPQQPLEVSGWSIDNTVPKLGTGISRHRLSVRLSQPSGDTSAWQRSRQSRASASAKMSSTRGNGVPFAQSSGGRPGLASFVQVAGARPGSTARLLADRPSAQGLYIALSAATTENAGDVRDRSPVDILQLSGSNEEDDEGVAVLLSGESLVWFALTAWLLGLTYEWNSPDYLVPSGPSTIIPEPSALVALGMGCSGLIGVALRRRAARSHRKDNR